jgi:hypothetical protein
MEQIYQESGLQITIPKGKIVRRFDEPVSHGLTHCMKAVDFIVEEDNRYLYIELKNPDHPNSREKDKNKFMEKFSSGKLDQELKYKYRDTFLYEWAAKRANKPIHYLVLIALESIDAPLLLGRTEALKQQLPLQGPASWKECICAECGVFNIEKWNKSFPTMQVKTI